MTRADLSNVQLIDLQQRARALDVPLRLLTAVDGLLTIMLGRDRFVELAHVESRLAEIAREQGVRLPVALANAKATTAAGVAR